jgi:glycosyltransferase involved in cell wall biosynthesis
VRTGSIDARCVPATGPGPGGPAPVVTHVLASADYGGAERVAAGLALALRARRDITVDLAVPAGGAAERALRELGIAPRVFDLDDLLGPGPLRSAREALRIVGGPPYGRRRLLHFHAPFVYGAARRAVRAAGLRSVVHLHLDYGAQALEWPLRTPPEAVVACAAYLRAGIVRALRATRGRRVAVDVIRNAIDTDAFRPGPRDVARAAAGLPADGFTAAIVANLAPHKGQGTAIRCIAELQRRGRAATLLVVGRSREPGSDHPQALAALATTLGVAARVRFLGERDDVATILRACDAVLLPSTSEGLPLSLLEAQASGAVVIAAPTAGIPEIVEDGVTGFLVAADDAVGYADRIEALIADPVAARTIAGAARERVAASHGWDGYVHAWERLYRDLLDPARSHAGPA